MTVLLSGVMDGVVAKEHVAAARRVRQLIAAYEGKRDLNALGAYAKGSDARVDRAIAAQPSIEELLCQDVHHVEPFADTVQQLGAIVARFK